MFTLALSSLSRISGFPVVPGLSSDFKAPLLTKSGKSAMLGRGLLHGPESLLNTQAVAK